MSSLLVYSPKYRDYSYGPFHPLRPTRLHLTHVLMEKYGLLNGPAVSVSEPSPADRRDLLRVHAEEYLTALERVNGGRSFHGALRYGLGHGDNPVFEGVNDWSRLVCGGTLEAVRAVAGGRALASFHTGGGFHHAHRSRAAGFCYLNDAAVAIAEQVEEGRRVLYLDVDAHHGDGVQEAFYATDRVMTVSIHETGDYLFPGSGYVDEVGEGVGEGFSVNIPLHPGSSDQVFTAGFEAVVPPLLGSFRPDIVVVQLGVDGMGRDPLAHLMYTTASVEFFLKRVKELYGGPLTVLGGGGYEMDTVARTWTLAWSILTDQEVTDTLPDEYIEERARYGATGDGRYRLRDPDPDPKPDQAEQMRQLERVLSFLRDRGILP
ncbi:MAG: acetoin utilization protein AcuC [bacterium]|nr:MAG: acetoin utilization protein AcuC [bacterium]